MNFYDISFFNRQDEKKPFHIHFTTKAIIINCSEYYSLNPSITIYTDGEVDFIQFKNAVVQAYEKYLRNKKETSNG